MLHRHTEVRVVRSLLGCAAEGHVLQRLRHTARWPRTGYALGYRTGERCPSDIASRCSVPDLARERRAGTLARILGAKVDWQGCQCLPCEGPGAAAVARSGGRARCSHPQSAQQGPRDGPILRVGSPRLLPRLRAALAVSRWAARGLCRRVHPQCPLVPATASAARRSAPRDAGVRPLHLPPALAPQSAGDRPFGGTGQSAAPQSDRLRLIGLWRNVRVRTARGPPR
mmetsp:Transcript_27616/g.84105  ORF Transcript_27616/g.84105 Transcript_27616/m.84105 type:complete len:227 (-) Transcript_27616:1070-1750(-)